MLALLLPCSLCAAAPAPTTAPSHAVNFAPEKHEKPDFVPDGYKVAFSDEFDGQKLNTEKWQYRTGPRHWSFQKPENVSVSDGTLKLHLKKEKVGDLEYTAGGIISRPQFVHGFYQARLKIPAGKGWHTSFWMMYYSGTGGGSDQNMTTKAQQEVDVIENDSISPRSYSVNFHEWLPVHKSYGHKRISTPDLSADFYVFSCEFTEKVCKFYFDGTLVQVVSVDHFKHGPQHVWLTSIASKLGNTDKVDDAKLPAVAEFDWVRIWTKP